MISLSSMSDLFRDDSSIPKDALKHDILKDLKTKELVGISDDKLNISFQGDEGDDILIRVVDPRAAVGYLVHQDETEYNDWMASNLKDPSDEDIGGV